LPDRRAIVCYVDDHNHVIQQALALRQSWLYSECDDTDLVAFGPESVVSRLPEDVVRIVQAPAADDPVWRKYRRVNSITCFNGTGSEQLESYSHLLRTDVDTFITPAWNEFRPTMFTHGKGGYSNSDDVRQRIRDIAAEYGLQHRGITNVGATWYGSTSLVRRAAAFTELLAKHIITHIFATDEGKWPGWFRGVSVMYACEIAVNHCAPDAERTHVLDSPSTSELPIVQIPHIHCWHTDKKFSKHWFMSRRYTEEDAQNLDLSIVRDYCMEMAFRSLEDLKQLGFPH